MADDDEGGFWDRLMSVWWGKLVVAAIFFGLALLLYWYISFIESQGGGRVNWIIALVYNWAGKIGTVLLFVIPGTLFAIAGLWQLYSGGEDSE